MANKRTLKKQINLVCEDLLTEYIAASLYGNNPNGADTEALLFSIIKLRTHYISRISHPEPGMPAKKYYQDLIIQFRGQVNEILDQINNI